MQEMRIQTNGKNHAKNLSFLFNGKRGSTVAHKTKKKKKSGKKNPFYGQHRGTHKGRPHRNPMKEGRAGIGGDIETVLGAVAAAVGSDLIENSFPQFNSGLMGYLADAVLGGLILWGGGRFVGKRFANGALAGVAVKISIRALQDIGSSPANAIAANIRDAQAAAPAAAQQQPPAQGPMGRPVAWNFPIPASYKQLPSGGFAQSISLSGMGRAVPMRPLRRRVV